MERLLSALLVPTERPPLALDIKRALLLFDQVHVMSADDRELIPPEHLMGAALPIPVPVGISQGPALPLGKWDRYDEVFDSTLQECAAAIQSGDVVIRSTPKFFGNFIGNPPLPDGWADPKRVFQVFRFLAADTSYLRSVCTGLPTLQEMLRCDVGRLAPDGIALRLTGNYGPPPPASLDDVPSEFREFVTRLARARLGSVVKTLGICQRTGFHPFSTDAGVSSAMDTVQEKASQRLASALAGSAEADEIRRAKRVERIIFRQELGNTLDKMSMSDVLKSRTMAWRKAAEARALFFKTIRKLSNEVESDHEFDRAVQKAIESYNKSAIDLATEWEKIKIKISVPVLLSGLSVALESTHLVDQLVGINSWDAVLHTAAIAAGVRDHSLTREHAAGAEAETAPKTARPRVLLSLEAVATESTHAGSETRAARRPRADPGRERAAPH